jgi:hypothetical protein
MPSLIASSPLKVAVTEKGAVITATDHSGAVVVEGLRGKRAAPASAVLTTAAQTWTISANVDHVRQVQDAAGVVVAEIRGGGWRHDTIVTGDGSEIPSKSRGAKPGYGASFGSLASARAPWLTPKRPFKLTLSDELLARPDCEMLVAVFAHVAHQKIVSAIRSAQTSTVST